LAIFENRNTAMEETNSLKKQGHNVFLSKINPFSAGKVWYSVRIGFFHSLDDAIKYKKKYFKYF